MQWAVRCRPLCKIAATQNHKLASFGKKVVANNRCVKSNDTTTRCLSFYLFHRSMCGILCTRLQRTALAPTRPLCAARLCNRDRCSAPRRLRRRVLFVLVYLCVRCDVSFATRQSAVQARPVASRSDQRSVPIRSERPREQPEQQQQQQQQQCSAVQRACHSRLLVGSSSAS